MDAEARLDVIMKVARKLSEWSGAEGRLVLYQFGVEATRWNDLDNPYEYLLRVLEDVAAEKLRALFDYLYPGGRENGLPVDAPDLWKPQNLRLFCSHRDSDKAIVADVKQNLAEVGIDCFVAHQDS